MNISNSREQKNWQILLGSQITTKFHVNSVIKFKIIRAYQHDFFVRIYISNMYFIFEVLNFDIDALASNEKNSEYILKVQMLRPPLAPRGECIKTTIITTIRIAWNNKIK